LAQKPSVFLEGNMHFFKIPPSALSKNDFIAQFKAIYEKSPWVADEATKLGVTSDADTAEGLSEILKAVVDRASQARKLSLLRSHPELGGKLRATHELTESSRDEQKSAGLDLCSPKEVERFKSLNEQYNRRFDFPFILAVTGYTRADILEVFANRLKNDYSIEFYEALRQVHKIALIRLRELAKKEES